jgi:hypothetical protein
LSGDNVKVSKEGITAGKARLKADGTLESPIHRFDSSNAIQLIQSQDTRAATEIRT